jgi:hypothetical protein
MAVAAITPRVRTFVICDDVAASLTEDGVFTLAGVRQRLPATFFPWHCKLSVFLLLSSPRKAKYAGKILVVNLRTERLVRYAKFSVAFQEANELLPMYLEISDCVFPEAGPYSFEIYFSTRGEEAMKGEHPFTLHSPEE